MSEFTESRESMAPSKESGSLKMKRILASKMSESRSGRALIHRLAGNIGTQIMDSLYSCFVKFSDVRTAQNMRVNIYKIATKTAVFVSENIITDEMMRTCKTSNVLLLYCLVEQFQTPVRLRTPEALHSLFEDCYRAVFALLSPIPNSSPERLTFVKDFVLHRGFLEYVLTSPDIDLEREVILSNMNNIMAPYEDEAMQMALQMKDSLQKRRQELAALVAKPQLVHFLRRQDTAPLLQEWLVDLRGKESLRWLHFYSAIRDYMGVSNRALLPPRASAIYDRYIDAAGPFAVELPAEIQFTLRESIQCGNCPPALFSEALAFVISSLQDDFQKHFPSSAQFEELKQELEGIDNKMIAFFHEDPTEFLIHDEADVPPSMIQRLSFWQK